MRLYFNRFRLRAEAEALFAKSGRRSRSLGGYVKGRYLDRVMWSLKGWVMRSFTDKREKRREKR